MSGERAEASMGFFVKGATYPIELFLDARRLAEEAKKCACKETDKSGERTFARAAIFTAFNFLESLLVELTQQCLRDPNIDPRIRNEIEKDMRGRKGISCTIKTWPEKLGKRAVHGLSEFGKFKELRQLRNNLIHPKLDPLEPKERTQDELLKEANAGGAAEYVREIKKMAGTLCESFGLSVPPEFKN